MRRRGRRSRSRWRRERRPPARRRECRELVDRVGTDHLAALTTWRGPGVSKFHRFLWGTSDSWRVGTNAAGRIRAWDTVHSFGPPAGPPMAMGGPSGYIPPPGRGWRLLGVFASGKQVQEVPRWVARMPRSARRALGPCRRGATAGGARWGHRDMAPLQCLARCWECSVSRPLGLRAWHLCRTPIGPSPRPGPAPFALALRPLPWPS